MMTRGDYQLLARHVGALLGETDHVGCSVLKRRLVDRLNRLTDALMINNGAFNRRLFLDAVVASASEVVAARREG